MERRKTKKIRCGELFIGGDAPITIQSMTNVSSHDEKALVSQISRLTDAGCDIVRIAVPDAEAAEVFARVRKAVPSRVPLVADIHFDYRLAIAAMKAGADKIRINPGNIGSADRLKAVVDEAKVRGIPIRVGVNSGSLEKPILEKYGRVTAAGLAESALNNAKLIEDFDYDNIVISIKSSDVKMNYDAHVLLAEKCDYPFHVGITEAGTLERGKVKSAIGIGGLLLAGIGDTMRVSLTADPVEEVIFAKEILKNIGYRKSGVNLVSCPTCGRTKLDLARVADEVEKRLVPIDEKLSAAGKSLKVAVMGCAVNGPGEANEADFGICGGAGSGLIIAKGEIIKKVSENELVDELIKMIEANI